MLGKTDSNASWFVVAALGLFFIGGLLTTVAPPLLDKSWSKPFENHDPAKGPTGKLVGYTEQEMRGYRIYIREGCWYCHTQQTRTLVADTMRSGWRGVIRPSRRPTIRLRQAHSSAPSAPVRTFRASAANTTSSGTARISATRATWCPAQSCRRSRGSPMTNRNSTSGGVPPDPRAGQGLAAR